MANEIANEMANEIANETDNLIIDPDKKYSLKYVIMTDVVCFLIGFGFHYLVEEEY